MSDVYRYLKQRKHVTAGLLFAVLLHMSGVISSCYSSEATVAGPQVPDQSTVAGKDVTVAVQAGDKSSIATFAAANALYRQGKYDEAAKMYSQVLLTNANTAVMFNLGNAYFKCWQATGGKSDKPFLGQAILCYEKVLWADPRNMDAQANLAYARSFIEDKFEDDGSTSPILRYMGMVFYFPSVSELETAFLILVCLVVVVLSLRRRTRKELFQEFFFWLLFLLIPLTAIAGIWSGIRAYQFEITHEAIILASQADVTGSPSLDGTKVFSLHEGTKVSVVRRSSGWVHISLPNGFSGWVREEQLGFIQRL